MEHRYALSDPRAGLFFELMDNPGEGLSRVAPLESHLPTTEE